MRQARRLDFEGLEGRMLLTRAHVGLGHAVHAAVANPVVLDGTLMVDNSASSTNMDVNGGMTTSTPVAGTLVGLGKVRGIWDESVDQLGDYSGPDTIVLRNSQGSLAIAFNNANGATTHRTRQGNVSVEEPQRVMGGTGAYTRASETGIIDVATNSARTVVTSMTLGPRPTK